MYAVKILINLQATGTEFIAIVVDFLIQLIFFLVFIIFSFAKFFSTWLPSDYFIVMWSLRVLPVRLSVRPSVPYRLVARRQKHRKI